MKVNIFTNDKNERELEVFAHDLRSRKKFVSILCDLDGVEIIRWPTIFSFYEFCVFEFEGYRFRLYVDDWSYTYCFSSPEVSQDVLNKLARHFENYELYIPKPRATNKPLVALLLALLGVAIVFGLYSMGYIGG